MVPPDNLPRGIISDAPTNRGSNGLNRGTMETEPTVVRSFPNEIEGELARGFLASAGISAFIRRIHSPLDDILQGVELLVPSKDRGKAIELLKQRDDRGQLSKAGN